MFVDDVSFERLQDPPPAPLEGWKMRVFLRGSEYEVRSAPLVVTVGELYVDLLVPMFDEEGVIGVQGLLADIPQAGDEVKVGYADSPLLPTGFEFSETLDA